MSDSKSDRDPSSTSAQDVARTTIRTVSGTLEAWARRVGALVAEVSETVTMPDELRGALEGARAHRIAGQTERARIILREAADRHPNHPYMVTALALTAVHELHLFGRLPHPLGELLEATSSKLDPKPPALRLWHAVEQFAAGQPAGDELRRALRATEGVPSLDAAEFLLLASLVGAAVHERDGQLDRAVREIQRARGQLPELAGSPLRARILEVGARLLLTQGRLHDAERWVLQARRERSNRSDRAPGGSATTSDAPEQAPRAEAGSGSVTLGGELETEETAWLARVMAARGDVDAAEALLARLPDEGQAAAPYELARLSVSLCLAEPGAKTRALHYLQRKVSDPGRRRLWALAELGALERESRVAAPGLAAEIIEALVAAHDDAPKRRAVHHARELAHAALQLEHFPDAVVTRVRAAMAADRAAAGSESALMSTLVALTTGEGAEAVGEHFVSGSPPRFHLQPDLEPVGGPDERSPLRDPRRRDLVLHSRAALAEALHASHSGQPDAAEHALVRALMEDPQLITARRLMSELVRGPTGPHLEDTLSAATLTLSAVPSEVHGVSLRGAREGLERVIAARERLARPLTIAIMGEFSSGKSTFVNALLGETVAPMGVLPTTSTINVFRPGSGQGARVHYRDGRISTVAADDLEAYLQGIDGEEASRIRYVEIERVGGRTGDAAVVDTPGLNALDAYHEQVAREFLDEADAVVWIFSATQGGTASQAEMLGELREGGRQVLGILNKVDTLDEAEQAELSAYLRKQLGAVLVEVVPLSATLALAYRSDDAAMASSGPDPFAGVEEALERHFLARARELKVEVTRRRLREALELARESVVEAVGALERRADAHDVEAELRSERKTLAMFARRLHARVLELDDILTRELLTLGLVVAGEGRGRSPDPQDLAYLEASFEDAALAVLADVLGSIGADHPTLVQLLADRMGPWTRGHLLAQSTQGFCGSLLAAHGASARGGEETLRVALRGGLVPVADAWEAEVRSLFRELEHGLARARRHSSSAPKAEALRLRMTLLGSLDQLLERT